MILEKVRFKPVSSVILENPQSSLDVIGSIMNRNQKIRLNIVGYLHDNKNLAMMDIFKAG